MTSPSRAGGVRPVLLVALAALAALWLSGGCGAAGWTVAIPPPARLPPVVEVRVEGRDQEVNEKLTRLLVHGLRSAGYRTPTPAAPADWQLRIEVTGLDRRFLLEEKRLHAQLVVRGLDARGRELFFLTLDRRTYPRAGQPGFKIGPHLVDLSDVIVARLPEHR